MKSIKSYLSIALLAGVGLFCSCSDSYMEDMNTDPSKAATINPNAQLTTAELQLYGDLSMVEIYRNYLYAFNQQLMGCWNTTNYGGRHTRDDSEMSRMWKSLYSNAIKNITDALVRSKDKENMVNVNAVSRIYRVYLMSVITDIYGDCPYTEAGRAYSDNIYTPKFDQQKDIYYDFFKELTEATAQLDATKDKISGDVIFDGDLAKWKKLANSLRLRYAMRISDVDEAKARQEFEAAVKADGGLLEDGSDDAYIHYMTTSLSFGSESYTDYRGNRLSQLLFGPDPVNNPSYICSTFFNQMYNSGDPRTFMIARCYYDGLMSATGTDNRVDLTQEVIQKGKEEGKSILAPRDPGAYSWEPWPSGYDSEILTNLKKTNPSVDKTTVDREVEPKLANNFLKTDNPGIIMTSAEVKFLLAEATLKGWNVGRGTVEELYKEGVRQSMDLLSDKYGCDKVSDADFEAFIAKNGIGHTAEQAKQAINTQAWILHFTNPNEAWANLRRSGYPKLKSPADYGFSAFLVDGQEIPVRLCYPVLENSYNKDNYQEALSRMGGKDSWNTRVWWDVK